MKSKHLALSLAAMALMSAPALAADSSIGADGSASATTGQVSVDANVAAALDMQALDTDRNGSVSENEFSAQSTLKSEESLFQSLDANSDGALSETELSSYTVEPSTIAPSSK